MELSPKQQITELIKKSERILIVGHKNHGGDVVGSMLALGKVLSAEGKAVSLVLSEKIEQNLQFLPNITEIKRDISGQRDLVVSIAKNKYPIEKISYLEEDGELRIIISPLSGNLTAKDLAISESAYKYDLIFVLDTPDVEKIDPVYDKYTELFFEVPIVNIDHHSGNEYFGTVNLVDLTATSTAEILVSIIEALGAGKFDADVATCLLTGLIADTASFRNTNTSPKALTISAQMLAAGARQQEIIQNLYKTRPLNILKLWGKVLSNMKYESEHRLIWSKVTASDLAESGASAESIRSVLDELLASAPGTDVVAVLAEEEGKLHGYLKGLNGQDVLSIAELFGGHGSALSADFIIGKATLATHSDNVTRKILEKRDQQLGKIVKEEVPARKIDVKQPEVAEKRDPIVIKVPEKAAEVEPMPEFAEDTIEDEPSLEEILAAVPVTEPAKAEESLDDSIENAIKSIDYEIETGTTVEVEVEQTTPNVDIEETKSKAETLRKLGEVMRGYTPGQALSEKNRVAEPNGKQPIDPTVWKA